jgi:small subunit ribosomal protein S6
MERRHHMREYELYLVIDADLEEEDLSAIIERLTGLISAGDGKTKGEVIKVDPRGKRRLAYPINKKRESQDTIINFQTSPLALPEMERFLKLSEPVLRYLLVRTGDS